MPPKRRFARAMPEDTPNQPKQSRRSVSGTVTSAGSPEIAPSPQAQDGPIQGQGSSDSGQQHSAELLPDETPFDVMTCVPSKVFATTPFTDDDTNECDPGILSIVVTQERRLVMADVRNQMIKVAELANPAATVQGLKLHTRPNGLCVFRDGQVAVALDKKRLYFLDVRGAPSVALRVRTAKQYHDVSYVMEDDALVSSFNYKGTGLDIITRAGVVLGTLTDSKVCTHPCWLASLCVVGQEVLVSDTQADTVFRVDLDTGRVVGKLTHPDLKRPHQVPADGTGNCYIASSSGECVLVVTPGGRWRRMLDGPDSKHVLPHGVFVTDWGVVVTWLEKKKGASVRIPVHTTVTGYQLKKPCTQVRTLGESLKHRMENVCELQ